MTPRRCPWLAMAGVLALLAGCARPAARPPRPEPEPPPAAPAASHEIAETTVSVADPEGRWTFEVESERVEAASLDGPYVMEPAQATYAEVGRPPVTLSARRAHMDRQAQRVLFEGQVRVMSEGWALDADRVEYDLKTGEVIATGRTKWMWAEQPAALPERSPVPERGGTP